MASIRILSAGAAQAVVEKIAATYARETANEVKADFSAVGAMKARVVAGEAVDIVILTAALIDELIGSGHVAAGTRADLGKVGTGVAVRAGSAKPDIAAAPGLREALLGANAVVFPDPATATAGKVVMQLFERLGVSAEVVPKSKTFPNGYAAMGWLAGSAGQVLGITQITEILANPGVSYCGPLPGDLQVRTVYSAGLSPAAGAAARDFYGRLTSADAKRVLAEAGYEVG